MRNYSQFISSAALSPCPFGAVYSATKVKNCVVCHDIINP